MRLFNDMGLSGPLIKAIDEMGFEGYMINRTIQLRWRQGCCERPKRVLAKLPHWHSMIENRR